MRSSETIRAEIAAFEGEIVRPIAPPVGTPNRKAIWKAACKAYDDAQAEPSRCERRIALFRELSKALAGEKRQASLARRKADPIEQLRQKVFRRLRQLGFRRERGEAGGSAYYRRGNFAVRISDHDVPFTAERQWNRDEGGFSWAANRWSLIINEMTSCMDAARWLVEVRRKVRATN